MINEIILYSLFSGITILAGGIIAYVFNHHVKESPVKYEIIHTLMSFGAGIILSALALVLIPQAMAQLDVLTICVTFLLGAIAFMMLDRYLTKKGGQTATLLAMMMDFIPESIALGAVFVADPSTATLLAIIIGLQNLPEAFNSFRDLIQSGYTVKKTLIIFFFASFFGIFGALLGHFVLSDFPDTTALLMTFASGGILYLLIQDIIPSSKLESSYLTSFGAIIGFIVGIVGEMLT